MLLLGVVTADEPRIDTVAGTGREAIGPVAAPLETNLGNPFGVEWGPDGKLYVCEVTNHRVWQLDLQSNRLSVVAGTGQQGYSGDGGPATGGDSATNRMKSASTHRATCTVVEMQNHVVRRVDHQTGIISTVAGTGVAGDGGDGGRAVEAQLRQPHSIALDDRGFLYIADIGNHRIRRVDLERRNDRIVRRQRPARNLPQAGQAVQGPSRCSGRGPCSSPDRTLWVALREGHSVWKIDLDDGRWIHVAGTGPKGYSGDGGPATAATFNGPKGIAVDGHGDLYIADTENQVIRHIDASSGIIQTLAGTGPEQRGYGGDDGPARQAKLNRPHGVCVTAEGRRV